MSAVTTINLLDLVDAIGEGETKNLLSDFSCSKNQEIENYVRKNALDFARRKISMTHLVIDDQGRLAAMFALTHKAIEINGEGLSKTTRSKLQRFAELDETTDCFSVSAFLIAQFGKDDLAGYSLSGDSLMASALDVLTAAQRNVGGGVVYLECENRPRLLEFYQSSHNGVFAPLANVSLKKTKWSTYSCFVSSEVEITIWELTEKATGKSYNKRYISNRNAEG